MTYDALPDCETCCAGRCLGCGSGCECAPCSCDEPDGLLADDTDERIAEAAAAQRELGVHGGCGEPGRAVDAVGVPGDCPRVRGRVAAAMRWVAAAGRLWHRVWRWYAPRPLDEVLAEAIERGIRHDEAMERHERG